MDAPRPFALAEAGSAPDVATELGRQSYEIASLRASVEALAATVGTLSARLAARDDDTLTAAEVCDVLHVGRTKLSELVATGALPMWKLAGELRITRGGLSAYIRRCATEGAATGPKVRHVQRAVATARKSQAGEVRRGR